MSSILLYVTWNMMKKAKNPDFLGFLPAKAAVFEIFKNKKKSRGLIEILRRCAKFGVTGANRDAVITVPTFSLITPHPKAAPPKNWYFWKSNFPPDTVVPKFSR